MPANRYRVPKKQWRRWSDQARTVFNTVFSTMRRAPWVFQVTVTGKPGAPARAWRVTCWNAAWIAASACDKA